MGIVIQQGSVWHQNQWAVMDILIEEGVIKEITSHISESGHQIINAKEKIVVPGFIDLHVHLREPGFEDKETIETGVRAAVKGGFTTIAPMPNTRPVTDNEEIISFIIKQSKKVNMAKVIPIGAITVGEMGEELADFEAMAAHSVLGFSDDGKGIQTASLMKKAMEKAKGLQLPIIAHCEDESLVEGGVIHNGWMAKELQVPGITSESEYIQIARDLLLAEITGVHYHVCHISTKESVRLIREAKERGVKVTAEVTPHHLLLTEMDIKEPYSNFKMNPPLRTKEDQMALLNGLLDGTIDFIATDHAPHQEEEKKQGLLKAPFGIVGLDIAFPLLYTHLVKNQKITLEQLIEWMSVKPAEAFHLNGGRLEVGEIADITIIDLNKQVNVDPTTFASKGKNTPFTGWSLFGWPVYTLVDGEIKWKAEVE